MPKELTHWHIAREVLQRGIPMEVEGIIASNPALYYIGAVAHDIGFYDLSKPSEANTERVANRLHGVNGEDTLVPLIEILESALRQNNKMASLSFILGMLTHFVVDSIFHPMVYYMSGNYFSDNPEERGKAVFRHRLLETAMDLWLQTVDPIEYPVDLNHLWSEAGEQGPQVIKLLVTYYTHQGDKSTQIHFKKAWRNHRFLQNVFSWSFPCRILAHYRRHGYPEAEKLEALFYSQPLNLSHLDETLYWRHPVTGEGNTMTLKELYNLSINKVVKLFNLLGVHSIEDWPVLLQELSPLSLDSGLPYVPVKNMKYFATEPIEHKLRV